MGPGLRDFAGDGHSLEDLIFLVALGVPQPEYKGLLVP